MAVSAILKNRVEAFMRAQMIGWPIVLGAIVLFRGLSAEADDLAPSTPKIDRAIYQKTVDRGAQYLLSKGQAPDGSYSAQTSPAVTAICVTALLRSGHMSVTDVCIAVGFTSLGSFSSTFTRLVGEPPSAYKARDHSRLTPVPPCMTRTWARPGWIAQPCRIGEAFLAGRA